MNIITAASFIAFMVSFYVWWSGSGLVMAALTYMCVQFLALMTLYISKHKMFPQDASVKG